MKGSISFMEDTWFYRRRRPNARLRLFCFPFAGGTAGTFSRWPDDLPAHVELCAVELPGRRHRLREPAFRRMDELVSAVGDALTPELDLPFAFFGHSMGALVAYELACRQSRAGGIQPVALFVSGAAAPHLGRAGRRISQLPDDALLADVSAFGGIPDELLADREAMAPYLPTLRADFEVFESYQHRARARLDQPTYLFGGERDHCVSSARLSAWREVTTVASVELFSGGHFYLQEHRRALTASIGTVLVQHLTRSTAA